MKRPTSDDIKAYRAEHGCGLKEANDYLTKLYIIDRAEDAENIEDIKQVLYWVLEHTGPVV